LAVEGEEFYDGAANFAARVLLDGFDQRLNLAGFGHGKQQAQGVVSVLSAVAREIFDRSADDARRGQGDANISSCSVELSSIARPNGSAEWSGSSS